MADAAPPDRPITDGPPAAAADDDAPCGCLSTGPDGTIVEVNETFLRWTGHTRAALLAGKRFADLLTVPGKIFYGTQFAPLLQLQGAVYEVAFDVKCPAGGTLPILVNAVVRRDAAGRPLRTRFAVFNATQRRRYERELLQARRDAERLAAVVASSGDAVFSVDAQGSVDSWNGGAEQMFGTPARAAIGQPLAAALPLAEPGRLAAVMDQVRQGTATPAVELELSGPTAGGRCVSVVVSAIRDAMDRLTGLSVIGRDVTHRRDAERLRAEEVAAHQAVAAAEASSRAKSEFLANMSHEIRTPLNGVVGMLHLLGETPLDERQRRFAGVANASAQSLLTLINDILDFSKIEAGKLELERLPFDLNDVAEQAAGILWAKAGEKGLAVLCEVDAALARRRLGPGDRVRQVLVNLLGNAVKFTDCGSVTLRVTADGDDPDAVRFAVTDTGIGIPPDRLDRLFKSFSQVDASTTRQYGGTGLGLAISKQLAGLMGGTVGVASTVGVGSTFWFTAKLPADATDAVGRAAVTPSAVAPAAELAAGRRILVAEDNDVNQMVVGEMLRRLGYTVDLVDNGRAAVAAVAGGGYDLVLMDCQMPEMDGFAATAALRAAEAARPTGPRLPVIALTANAVKGDRERCLAAGMDDYLSKPIDAAALTAKLAQWLGAARPVAA